MPPRSRAPHAAGSPRCSIPLPCPGGVSWGCAWGSALGVCLGVCPGGVPGGLSWGVCPGGVPWGCVLGVCLGGVPWGCVLGVCPGGHRSRVAYGRMGCPPPTTRDPEPAGCRPHATRTSGASTIGDPEPATPGPNPRGADHRRPRTCDPGLLGTGRVGPTRRRVAGAVTTERHRSCGAPGSGAPRDGRRARCRGAGSPTRTAGCRSSPRSGRRPP